MNYLSYATESPPAALPCGPLVNGSRAWVGRSGFVVRVEFRPTAAQLALLARINDSRNMAGGFAGIAAANSGTTPNSPEDGR